MLLGFFRDFCALLRPLRSAVRSRFFPQRNIGPDSFVPAFTRFLSNQPWFISST